MRQEEVFKDGMAAARLVVGTRYELEQLKEPSTHRHNGRRREGRGCSAGADRSLGWSKTGQAESGLAGHRPHQSLGLSVRARGPLKVNFDL